MTSISEKQKKLNNAFKIKSRKILSILVVFLLVLTIMDSVNSAGIIKTEKPMIDNIEDIDNLDELEDQINNSIIIDEEETTTQETLNRGPKTLRHYTLLDALKRYFRYRGIAQTSLFMFYTNYSGIEISHSLKLYRFVDLDVNGDGKFDISVKIRLYPYLEKDLSLSINFEYLIKRLNNFPDIYASLEAYGELYFPGFLLKRQNGNRIRIGYESSEGEEVPSKCSITYKYQPNIFRIRKRPEHGALLRPGSITGDSKLALIFSYANLEGENVISELRSRTSYDPAVKSKLTINGNGIFGGSKFEFIREVSHETKIDMTISFMRNNSEIIGYVKDLPEMVTFTIDNGKDGFIEFDTHGSPPSEIGLCDDFYNPKSFVFFKDLPSKAIIDWERDILKQKNVNISLYTIGTGISFLGHFDFIMNGSFDFNISSKEKLDCNLSIDGTKGYLVFDRCAVNITFSLSFKRINNSFDLSFNMTRFFDKPFEIYFGKLVNEEVQFSLSSKSFTVEDFKFLIDMDLGNFGIRAAKLIKEKNGSIKVNFSYVKNEGNLTFICGLNVTNGIKLYNLSLGLNGVWSPPQDIILFGNSSRYLEFISESKFEYFVSEDSSWGYFYFKGNFSYASYHLFEINNITGGFKGKILAKTGNKGLNISWHTINRIGYNITKISVSGISLGLENLHIFYGDIIDFNVPHLYGNIILKEVCNESGYSLIEFKGGQSYIDLNFKFNFTKEVNTSNIDMIVKIKDFHLDHDDRSAYIEALWNNNKPSYLAFHTENNINLSIGDMYLFFSSNGTPIFEIKNLTGYIRGYSGFNVNITTPINNYLTEETKHLVTSNLSLGFELKDVELDLEIGNFTLIGSFGRIAVAANATGSVKFSLINISIEKSKIFTHDKFNITWANITFSFNGRNGKLDLNYFNMDNLLGILEILGIKLTTVNIALENLYLKGYSEMIVTIGFIPKNGTILGLEFVNDMNSELALESLCIYLPDILIFNEFPRVYFGNIKINEGTFSVILDLIRLYLEIPDGSALKSFDFEAGITNSLEFNLSLAKPIEHLKVGLNPGLNKEQSQYFFIDTYNTTIALNMGIEASSGFLNKIIDLINENTNYTLHYFESDKGFRINKASLRADNFRVFLNFTNRPLYKGFLQLFGEGNIYYIVNDTWVPLFPGGEGFSFIIEEYHIQLKFDMAVEDLPVDFEVIFDNTGDKLVLSGLFTIYSDDLKFDVWWNQKNSYLKIKSSNDRSLEIDNFVFKYINESVEKIDFQTDLISILDGSYDLLFDTDNNIFELDFGGSILTVEEFCLVLTQISLNNMSNTTVNVCFESFNLLGGQAVFSSSIESDEYNWSIGSDRGVDWFELIGLNGSIENHDKPLTHFEAGIGLLQWNRSSNNFLRMKISKNATVGSIKFNRHSEMDGSFKIKDVYIKYISPKLKIPIGTRLRALTSDYNRNDHEYFDLDWKKGEYIDLSADIAATWKLSFDRFFDIFNRIARIDMISSIVDVNFSMHYEPSPDNDTANYLGLNIHEESSIELFEILNHYVSRFDKIMTIGKMNLEPGEISFSWLIDKDQGESWVFIDNDEVTGEFAGLTLRKGFYKIRLMDASIIYPGETFINYESYDDSGSLYISNSAELEFKLLEFSEGVDFLKVERDIEFGIITMLPGEFNANWINISDEDYDKELTVNNGIFEFTFTRFTLQLGNLKISFSLFNIDRVYQNDLTILIRQRGQGNRGVSINTDEPLQFDLFSIGISVYDWQFIMDLVELKADFNNWYLGMLDGKLTIGGNGTINIAGLSRFINITFGWKGSDSNQQKLFTQYCSKYENHPQTHALLFDTTNCTEQIDLIFKTSINDLNLNSDLSINPQKVFTLYFDVNPEPIENDADGHIFIDSNDEEVGNLAIEINKHVDYFGIDIGLYAEIELLKANNFYIWGEFVEVEIFGKKFWIPSGWGKSGSIDFVNVGLVKLIFNDHETEIWPCTPKAIPDKNIYGVTLEDPIVTFDISKSEGFAFNLQSMRWDWDGDGNWDSGSEPDHWIDYEDSIEFDFSELFEYENDSIKIYFQVKTIAAKSNIAEMTVGKGYAVDIEIEYDDKLYEFNEFKVTITNATSNEPIDNAFVKYQQLNMDGSQSVVTNYTNSNGKTSFTASEVPYDYYIHFSIAKLFVEADGYFDCESESFKIYDTDADLHGYTKNKITHKGIPYVFLVTDPGGYHTYSEDYYSGIQTGKFKLIVPPGIYDITASKNGYSSILLEDVDAIEGGYQYLGNLYLPPTEYGGLRGVLYDALNIDEELKGVAVTVEIPGEDDIVTATDYYGEFPDNYPSPTEEYYSIDLEPGSYLVRFEKDNYYTYEKQVEIVAGEITDITIFLYPFWVTPSGHNNPSEWNDEEDAHDSKINTATFTNIYWGSSWHWTEPLELSLSSTISCEKVRLYAKYIENRCDRTTIEIYYNNAWHVVYIGSFENKDWYEIDFGTEHTISKARVSFRIRKYYGIPTIAELFEFDFGLSQP